MGAIAGGIWIAEGEADFAYGDVFPHDVNFDQTGGVSFPKGCLSDRKSFPGCSIAALHGGVLTARSDVPLPPMGTPITVEDARSALEQLGQSDWTGTCSVSTG